MGLVIAGISGLCYLTIDKKVKLTKRISFIMKVKEKHKTYVTLYRSLYAYELLV